MLAAPTVPAANPASTNAPFTVVGDGLRVGYGAMKDNDLTSMRNAAEITGRIRPLGGIKLNLPSAQTTPVPTPIIPTHPDSELLVVNGEMRAGVLAGRVRVRESSHGGKQVHLAASQYQLAPGSRHALVLDNQSDCDLGVVVTYSPTPAAQEVIPVTDDEMSVIIGENCWAVFPLSQHALPQGSVIRVGYFDVTRTSVPTTSGHSVDNWVETHPGVVSWVHLVMD